MFRPITLWPFPEQSFKRVAAGASSILVPEMNAGQLCLEVERLCPSGCSVSRLNRIDGQAIDPDEILNRIAEMANHD